MEGYITSVANTSVKKTEFFGVYL